MMSNYIFNPLEQFEINIFIPISFLNLNFALTNLTLLTILVFFLISLIFYISFSKVNLFKSKRFFELNLNWIYVFFSTLTNENLGLKGQQFVPLLYSLFIYLLTFNLLGMIPYVFTVTSHISFTFNLALSLFIGINLMALYINKINTLNLFLPKGVPFLITPLLILIELISYIVKVFTLAIRLFTNMTSGHTLLKIVASFSWIMFLQGGLFSLLAWFPCILLILLILLETGIAILQAYVFTLLIIVYLSDVLYRH
uniref:ATP synthase F0 subunit 6 n=1 Tax=Porphyridium aerugineum TaxID=2792 RepID=UPI001FCD4F71|nr:ATP synthase F0 subunit 6 [Porphyridium aerugineum]UNJ18827.1 ATP synthase F0 subunit 6 [Porphyridium aerugineum]